jgi:hypothetical protein
LDRGIHAFGASQIGAADDLHRLRVASAKKF